MRRQATGRRSSAVGMARAPALSRRCAAQVDSTRSDDAAELAPLASQLAAARSRAWPGRARRRRRARPRAALRRSGRDAGARRRACPRASCSRRCSSSMRSTAGPSATTRPSSTPPTAAKPGRARTSRPKRSSRCSTCGSRTASAASPSARTARTSRPTTAADTGRARKFDAAAAQAARAQLTASAIRTKDLAADYHLNRIVGVGNRLTSPAEGGQLYRSDDRGRELARAALALRRLLLRPRCRSAARRCWPSACAATCSARPMPARPGTQLDPAPTAMLTDGVRVNDRASSSAAWPACCSCQRDAGETLRAHAAGRSQGPLGAAAGARGRRSIVAGEGGVRTHPARRGG